MALGAGPRNYFDRAGSSEKHENDDNAGVEERSRADKESVNLSAASVILGAASVILSAASVILSAASVILSAAKDLGRASPRTRSFAALGMTGIPVNSYPRSGSGSRVCCQKEEPLCGRL
jgi:hypothetical protein